MNEEEKRLEDVEDQTNEDSGTENNSTSEDEKAGKSNDSSKEKTFTQSQVSRMMAREKNQGRNAALNDLGIDPKDTKAMSQIKAFISSLKTDEQKKDEENARKDSEMRELESRALIAEAKAEAMMLGVKNQFVDDIVTLALNKMSDDSDLKTILGELKTKYSSMFEQPGEDDDKDKAGQKGTGSSIKSNKAKNNEKENSLGSRLAAQRKPSSNKKSYWNQHKI